MKTDTLINALVKAQQQIDHIVQDAKNPFFKSDYATLKAVFDSVKKPLNDNGIYIQQVSHTCDDGVIVETIFYGHGGFVSTGKVHIPAAKHDPQAYGSALSYAKRYSLLMACGIATTSEDDDAEKAMQRNVIKKYRLIASISNKAPIATAADEKELLNVCRRLLANPKDEQQQQIYAANKETIYKAMEECSDEETSNAFNNLIGLYSV